MIRILLSALVMVFSTGPFSAYAQTTLAQTSSLIEPDYFKEAVAMGKLPPIVDRLPVTPLTISFEGTRKTVGRYGGTLRTLGGQSKDTRLLVVYGYARLVGYSDTFELKADLAQRVDIVEGRTFTFHLRKGHRWSDGEPFTSEDFRYYWQVVASNTELSAFGIPRALMVDGERPTVDIIDDTTVRYSWSKPNPFFLPALAAAQPLYIYRPAHYLKAFHTDYTDAAKLQDMVKASGQRNWVALHYNHDRAYRNDMWMRRLYSRGC